MKIGTLAYHNAINYGAILQVLALQKIVESLGCECEVVDYASPAVELRYRRLKFREARTLKSYCAQFLTSRRLNRKKAAFREFAERYLTLSPKAERVDADFVSRYDAAIVGSDQVFNPKNTFGDATFLFDWEAGAKKIAYGASVGNVDYFELWRSQYGVDYQKLLSRFDALSFRERDAAEFAEKALNRPCATVADPTLVVGADFWKRFVRPVFDGDYIFVYNLGNIPGLVEIVKKVAKQTGLQVVVSNGALKGDLLLRKFRNESSLSPNDFIAAIAGAKRVVTDSFHGTVFSALLHKDFYSVVNPSPTIQTNSRIRNLLSQIGLSDRIATDAASFSFRDAPDFDEVDAKMEAIRQSSLAWLRAALKLD